MQILGAVLFSLAVSLDGFGVGLSYGIRQLRIPAMSMVVICLASTLAITVSMLSGWLVSGFISVSLAERLGGIILVGVGLWILAGAWGKKTVDESLQERTLVKLKLPGLGLAVQILKEPAQADFDLSGEINFREAVALGFALALDALGAGFGMAVAGASFWLTPLLVGLLKFVLITLGLKLGRIMGNQEGAGWGSMAPGIILLLLGIFKL